MGSRTENWVLPILPIPALTSVIPIHISFTFLPPKPLPKILGLGADNEGVPRRRKGALHGSWGQEEWLTLAGSVLE